MSKTDLHSLPTKPRRSQRRASPGVPTGDLVRLPIFRLKSAYCMDCYDTKLRKLVMVYPFIPRRNSKAPQYMSLRRTSTGQLRHFRFERVGERPTKLIYRQIRRRPNNRDDQRRGE